MLGGRLAQADAPDPNAPGSGGKRVLELVPKVSNPTCHSPLEHQVP